MVSKKGVSGGEHRSNSLAISRTLWRNNTKTYAKYVPAMTFLPVQRQVIAILRGDDVGQKPRAGQAFLAGLSGLDISTTDKDRARANAEAAGCLAGEDLVMICGMRLRLV